MDILNKAHEIVYDRTEEHTRAYGTFEEEMPRTARVLSEITRKEWTTDDVFIFYIVTKLLREGHKHKEDSLLDLVAYAAAYNEYKEKELSD